MTKEHSYRPDIDGLRAVAVLLVLGFHAFPDLVPGGYIGVDIFFVISGFLITGLVLDGLGDRSFSFVDFYCRRIRRIFPALLVVLVTCLVVGWFILSPNDYQSLGLNVLGGAAFFSNFVLLHQTGYFDLTALQNPLLHLWSLGIEEQYYLVWPLVLLTFSRRCGAVLVASTLLIISFVWNVLVTGTPADFYLPFTRAWELMIGGLLAVAASRTKGGLYAGVALKTALSPDDWASWLGLALILGGVIAGENNTGAFPGWWALLPTLGAALIISAPEASLNRWLLSQSWIVWLGLISYPLYLWHWPVLAFARLINPAPSWQLRCEAIAAALILAILTYRWGEQPIRAKGSLHQKAAALFVAMTFVAGAGWLIFTLLGFPSRLPESIRALTSIQLSPEFRRTEWREGSCFFDSGKSNFKPECLQQGAGPLLFLWGDSTSAAFYPGLKELQSSIDFKIGQYSRGGCQPSLYLNEPPGCRQNNQSVLSILQGTHPDIALLVSTWGSYGAFDDLKTLVAKLREIGVPRVIVMGPLPQWAGGLAGAVIRYYAFHAHLSDPIIPVRSSFGVYEPAYQLQRKLKEAVPATGAEYISGWDALCDGEACLTRIGNSVSNLIAFDASHLTIPASVYLAHAIAPCLFPRHGAPEGPDQSRICVGH